MSAPAVRGRRRTTIGLAAAAGLIAATLGCGGPTRPNVVLVTLDTTRADHLGCYGATDVSTPTMDWMAELGTLYESAILTGTYPVFHGVRDNNGFYVSPDSTTLAEVLKTHGYATAAFVGSFVLDSQTGIDQGFDLYDDSYLSRTDEGKHPLLMRYYDERPASEVSRSARAWLDGLPRSEPFFMWLHYWDPHQPYLPPEPYRTRYAHDPYSGEIASVDEALGRVFDKLREKDLLDNTYIVLTADHGEGLGEHGERTHALLLHDATTRVPLIIRDPQQTAPARVETLVTIVDILPTVLERIGIPVPEDCQGHRLPATDGEDQPGRTILSETAYGTINFGWSFIERLTVDDWVHMAAPKPRLYRRSSDPAQLDDLAADDPGSTASLSADLEARRSELARGAVASTKHQLSARAAARLEALGYIVSDGAGPDLENLRVDSSLPDPWEMMEVADLINEGKNHLDRRHTGLATAVFKRARERDPGNTEVARHLVLTALAEGRLEDARSELDRLAGQSPESVAVEVLYAEYCFAAADDEGAVHHLQRAVDLDPKNIASHLVLAHTLDVLGRSQEAEDAYRTLLEQSPDDALAMNSLAVLAFTSGRTEEAMTLLDRCLTAQPFFPAPYLNLAVIHHDTGDLETSLHLVDRALALRPTYARAHELRAMVLEGSADPAAIDAWREPLRHAPDGGSRARSEEALERLAGGG